MKQEVKTPLIVAIVALVVIAVGYFGFKTMSGAGGLDQGQVKYTPGKPPWEETDPSKKGPGGPPPVVPSAPPQTATMSTDPIPPGMSAPTVNNSGK
jgi:hypothetical protein